MHLYEMNLIQIIILFQVLNLLILFLLSILFIMHQIFDRIIEKQEHNFHSSYIIYLIKYLIHKLLNLIFIYKFFVKYHKHIKKNHQLHGLFDENQDFYNDIVFNIIIYLFQQYQQLSQLILFLLNHKNLDLYHHLEVLVLLKNKQKMVIDYF